METEERMNLLEDKVRSHEERLDRHSKRIYAVEDGLAKKSEEINAIRTDVNDLSAQLKSVAEKQEITNKKISSLDSKLDSHGKWLKFMVFAMVITLGVIFLKDSETAKSIVQILALLKSTAVV